MHTSTLHWTSRLPEKFKGSGAGLKKYSPRLRKHVLHKVKR